MVKKYEEPQKLNPNGITVEQHIFPRRSIERFQNKNGGVDLFHMSINKTRKTNKNDIIFSAMRVWDMRAEHGYMKDYEDEFQELADKIIVGSINLIEGKSRVIANRFFSLWKYRALYKAMDSSDIQLLDLETSIAEKDIFTKDEEEKLEKVGVDFIRAGGKIAARSVYSIEIQTLIMDAVDRMKNIEWMIIRSCDGQFLVPDFPSIPMIPITPTLSLFGEESASMKTGTISKSNVIGINKHNINNSKEYYFANDLRQCL